MKTITENQAFGLLTTGISGNTFAQIRTTTDPRMRKTDNPYTGAIKVSSINVAYGANYGNAVNRQAKREDNPNAEEFKPEPLPWGEWISGLENKALSHKGEKYLRFQLTGVKPEVHYLLEGKEISVDLLRPFLPNRKPSQRQIEHGNAKEVQVRAFKLSSIIGFTLNGEDYLIVR